MTGAIALSLGLVLAACEQPETFSILVEPGQAELAFGESKQFKATVRGAADTSVSWSVREGDDAGSISQDGAFTAGTTEGTFHIVATSSAMPDHSAYARVTVRKPPTVVVVTIDPANPEVLVGESITFTAEVVGADDTTVTWSVVEGEDGGSITSDGVYTAPAVPGSFGVRAVSNADPSRSAVATVLVQQPPAVEVSVSPTEVTLEYGQTQQFSATVTHATDSAVTWSVAQGAQGGSITADGLYTAPDAEGTYEVVATSVEDESATATATITVVAPPPPVEVTVSPAIASIELGQTQTFTATVTGSTNTSVTWSVQEGAAGGSITPAGVYSPPSVTGTFHVVATSVADESKSATATITVTEPPPPVEVEVSPSTANVVVGQTQQFSATVSNATNTGVLWTVQEGTAGGTVDSTGLYTAPQTTGTFHVVAMSAEDTSKTAVATVNVVAAPVVEVTVSPATALMVGGTTKTFSATVTGVPNTNVTWSVLEGAAGGSVDQNGEYTAPTTPGTYTVVATSVADEDEFATAQVTVSIPEPFTAGLEASFSADKLLGAGVALPADGTEVSTWLDLTPNARNLSQTNANRRPQFLAAALNGKPAIAFDGVDDHIASALFANALPQPTTIVILYRGPPSGTKANIIDAPQGTTQRNRIQVTETGGLQLYSTTFTTPGSPRAANQIHYLVARFEGSNSQLRVNGTTETPTNTNPGTTGLGGILLGQKQDLQPPAAYLELGEVLVYGRALTAAEVADLELYLRARYELP